MSASCDACGWTAATLSMIAFGSFGVPIKSDAANSVDIDPLVFQSYKTFMCFVTSWIVLLFGQELTFTPWGIVSGLFWVPGGVATVYAVRAAGLAVGIGIGSSFIVLVSFTWGIFIFNETVRSKSGASFAILLMMVGLWGMSYYSSPQSQATALASAEDAPMSINEGIQKNRPHYRGLNDNGEDDDEDSASENDELSDVDNHDARTMELDRSVRVGDSPESPSIHSPAEVVHMCGYKVSRRKLGLAAAVFNGTWGGSIMVPMHWSGGDTEGVGYVISFGIGASIVTLLLWLLRYMYHLGRTRSVVHAYHALPSLHIRAMWLAGGLSGTLWSIGNFFSMISVEYLGEGVGYSVVQAAMLVSGLWGIFNFREVVGLTTIFKWFFSAFLTVFGILLLSYEHHKPSSTA